MKKIFFLIFSMFLFSISFSETSYKVTTDKSVKLTKTEISQNNSQIEKQLTEVFSTDTYDTIKIKSILGIGENTSDADTLISPASSLVKAYVSNSKYKIEEIKYSDSKTANVLLSITSPNVEDYANNNEQLIEKQAEKTFKTLSGKTIAEAEKLDKEGSVYFVMLLASYFQVVSDNMGSMKNITKNTTIEMKKVNGTWTFDERLINDLVDF